MLNPSSELGRIRSIIRRRKLEMPTYLVIHTQLQAASNAGSKVKEAVTENANGYTPGYS
jgi:hypothetical protein